MVSKYSIDKVKLEFMYIDAGRVQNFLDSLEYDVTYTYYHSNSVTKCQHNFLFGGGDGSVYVGVVPNWKTEERHDKNIILEYNPNKVNPFMLDKLSWLQNIHRHNIKLMSFDIAVDFDLDYSLVRMLKRDIREYFAILGHTEPETRYLGALGHNHVKLYNKAKEQKLNGIDWTRFEITNKEIDKLYCGFDEFKNSLSLPKLYMVDGQINMDIMRLKDTDRIVLESIISDTQVLYTIKRYETRKRFEKLLLQFLIPLELNVDKMYKCYYDYFTNTFKH